ncbi:25872_t:CDS:2, partial [Gigaspora margarita]
PYFVELNNLQNKLKKYTICEKYYNQIVAKDNYLNYLKGKLLSYPRKRNSNFNTLNNTQIESLTTIDIGIQVEINNNNDLLMQIETLKNSCNTLVADYAKQDTQTQVNTKEILILAECGIMDYGTLELQEALNNNTGKNAASKRKIDPESTQEDTYKQSLTLTETIIQNSKCFKEDSTVSAQQSNENTLPSLKNEQPISNTKNEDIYSSQWAVTRNEAEASQKPTLFPKNK